MILATLVCAVVAATHWPALSARALCFDDDQYLLDNDRVGNPSWTGAWAFLKEVRAPSTVGGYYHPLSMISLMLDSALGGGPDQLRPYHRTSLVLHVANTALVIWLLHSLFASPVAAAAAGLLFGLHPLTVETIAWVGERKTLQSAFFSFASLVAYVRFVRGPSRRAFIAGLVFYGLALLSKPTATLLPVAMLLLDVWPLGRLTRRAIVEKAPFFLVAAVSAVVTFVSQRTTASVTLPTDAAWSRIPLLFCYNIWFYAGKIAYPVNLSSEYPVPAPFDASHPTLRAAVVASVVIMVLLISSLRWTRAVAGGSACFLVLLLPAMGIIGFTHHLVCDKFVYLPSIGLLIALVGLLSNLAPATPSRRAVWIVAAAVIVAAGLEARATRAYLRAWRDSETLFRHFLTVYPHSPYLHNNLGLHLLRAGRHAEAIASFRRALALNPRHLHARLNLTHAFLAADRLEEAFTLAREAVDLCPTDARARVNLGIAYARTGRPAEAVEHFQKALRVRPNDAAAHANFANVLCMLGRVGEGVQHYARAIELRPAYAHAHLNLGRVLLELGRPADAARHFEAALRLRPGDRSAGEGLAAARLRAGNKPSR